MLNENKIIRNGIEALTRLDVQCACNIAEEQARAMGAILRTISRLTDDREIQELCDHGALLGDLASNDLDVMSERAEKAGLVGELVAEVSHA